MGCTFVRLFTRVGSDAWWHASIFATTTKRQQQQHPLFKDDAGKSEDALVEECFYKKKNKLIKKPSSTVIDVITLSAVLIVPSVNNESTIIYSICAINPQNVSPLRSFFYGWQRTWDNWTKHRSVLSSSEKILSVIVDFFIVVKAGPHARLDSFFEGSIGGLVTN